MVFFRNGGGACQNTEGGSVGRAVRLVLERGVSVAQASRDLDIHPNVLRNWVREQQTDPMHSFPGKGQQKAEAAEVTQLKREVARLKMERDILKKAAVCSTGECNTNNVSSHRRWRGETTGRDQWTGLNDARSCRALGPVESR
jgi:transposase